MRYDGGYGFVDKPTAENRAYRGLKIIGSPFAAKLVEDEKNNFSPPAWQKHRGCQALEGAIKVSAEDNRPVERMRKEITSAGVENYGFFPKFWIPS